MTVESRVSHAMGQEDRLVRDVDSCVHKSIRVLALRVVSGRTGRVGVYRQTPSHPPVSQCAVVALHPLL